MSTDFLTLTDRARVYLRQAADNSGKSKILLSVDGGGCGGFQYKWDFTDDVGEYDSIVKINNEISLVIDATSEMFLIGAEIDYVNELGGSFLKINNPMASSSCGCGESFSVNESIWENNDTDRLEG